MRHSDQVPRPAHSPHVVGASISSLIPSLSCRRCSPNAPFAKLEMLSTGAAVRLAPPENGGTRHPGSRARRRSTQRKRRSMLSPSARRSPRRKGWDPECPSSPTGQSALNATQRPHDVARSHACLISNLCSHGTRFHASLADTRTLLHDRLHRLYPSQDSFVRGCIRLPFLISNSTQTGTANLLIQFSPMTATPAAQSAKVAALSGTA